MFFPVLLYNVKVTQYGIPGVMAGLVGSVRLSCKVVSLWVTVNVCPATVTAPDLAEPEFAFTV
jgi:hypothetical protein